MKKNSLILFLMGLFLATLPFAVLKAQTHSNVPRYVAPPVTVSRRTPTPAALDTWKRLRNSGGSNGMPLSAKVTVIHFTVTGEVHRRVELMLAEGKEGRYRIRYTSPTGVQGRVLLSDGKTLYQYEPDHKAVLRRPVINDEAALTDASGNVTDALVPILEGKATVAGRPVQKLALLDQTGNLLRRCFVDDATGRSLRTEEFNPENGRLLRRIEKRDLVFTVVDSSRFVPDFPQNSRILTAPSQQARTTPAEKRELGIPDTAGRYRLRNLMAPPESKSSRSSKPVMHHAIYTNGAHTVSLFVTTAFSNSTVLTPPEGDGWQSVDIRSGLSGYARTDEHGRSGVVWLRDQRRYFLAARIPLREALVLAHDLCTAL